MIKKLILIFLVSSFFNFLTSGPRLEFDQTALDEYVHNLDESYGYKVIKTQKGEEYTSYSEY